MRTHYTELIQCDVEDCTYTAKLPSVLASHKRHKHGPKEACEICSVDIFSYRMEEHIEQVHTTYTCPDCPGGVQIKGSKRFSAHMQSDHSKDNHDMKRIKREVSYEVEARLILSPGDQ